MTRALLLAATGLLLGACREKGAHDHGPAPTPAPAKPAAVTASPALPANPVQVEMRLMTAALQGGVEGIGRGDVRGLAETLHKVHAAKEVTAAALREGTYHPPKNGEDLAGFVELDEAFHKDLVPLVRASAANDVPATAEALGTVMKGCQGCHATFRDAP